MRDMECGKDNKTSTGKNLKKNLIIVDLREINLSKGCWNNRVILFSFSN